MTVAAKASDRLRLKAKDREDLQVIAACLQDALVPVRDMTYLPAERRFVLLLNRFRWETEGSAPEPGESDEGDDAEAPGDASFAGAGAGSQRYERVHCGLCFERVRTVRMKGIDRSQRDRILELLTIDSDGRSATLMFAGGAMIRLEIEAVHCRLEDLGDAWPTRWQPRHPPDDPETPPG